MSFCFSGDCKYYTLLVCSIKISDIVVNWFSLWDLNDEYCLVVKGCLEHNNGHNESSSTYGNGYIVLQCKKFSIWGKFRVLHDKIHGLSHALSAVLGIIKKQSFS